MEEASEACLRFLVLRVVGDRFDVFSSTARNYFIGGCNNKLAKISYVLILTRNLCCCEIN